MRYFGLCLCLGLAFLQGKGQSNIYGFSATAVDGTAINLSSFQGKKMLIVEAASQDSTFIQYHDLQRLSEHFRDSLVIIVLPTNSFNSEPLDDGQLSQVFQPSSGGQILVGVKVDVTGANIHPIFQWLTTASANGIMDTPVNAPFKKFLIDRNGRIAGVYSSKVNPMDITLFQAVQK